jgi:hypothetical protein
MSKVTLSIGEGCPTSGPPAPSLPQDPIDAWTITAILTIAGFYFALFSFEPFRLGSKSYLYRLGIAVGVPFLVENLLDASRMEAIVKTLTAVAATAGIASLMSLAVIRADLLPQQIQTALTS